jgi:glycyl-tRNA synthetase
MHMYLTLPSPLPPPSIRFRQHMGNEMAHYAQDCWDCEIHTSYGWIECVGCADRSCYDLEQHMKFSSQNLYASAALEKPIVENVIEVIPDKGVLGKKFKKEGKRKWRGC